MKKILATYLLLFIYAGIFAQTIFQGSIEPLPAAAGVTFLVRTPTAVTGKVSGLTVTIAIPVSVGARPPISATFPNTYLTATGPKPYDAINQMINGVTHYIYNIQADGNVSAAGATVTFGANADVPMAIISFGGDPSITSQIKVVNLPDGGTDPNPNSFFGLSIDGNDVVNQAAMFYAIPTISTAVNDGAGYAGTSYAQTTGLIPLPVKFLGFNVAKKDKDALLTWQIENETAQTDSYEIERSTNGTDFVKVDAISAKNNGNSSNSYNFTDNNFIRFRSSGVVYYRIKQLDKDGRFTVTNIRTLRLDAKNIAISIYPNPIKNFATISFDLLSDAAVKMTLNDASGKQVQTIPLQLFKGVNTKKIDMSKLAAGAYMLSVNTGEEIQNIALVKVN